MVINFVKERTLLREREPEQLIAMDVSGAHVQYKTLKLVKENNIIVALFPLHTSHGLQPLDKVVLSIR